MLVLVNSEGYVEGVCEGLASNLPRDDLLAYTLDQLSLPDDWTPDFKVYQYRLANNTLVKEPMVYDPEPPEDTPIEE